MKSSSWESWRHCYMATPLWTTAELGKIYPWGGLSQQASLPLPLLKKSFEWVYLFPPCGLQWESICPQASFPVAPVHNALCLSDNTNLLNSYTCIVYICFVCKFKCVLPNCMFPKSFYTPFTPDSRYEPSSR